MTAGARGLGRGLDALLGGTRPQESVNPAEVKELPLHQVQPNPSQPRAEFSEQGLQDLAASIKSQGVLQPVLVRPLAGGKYELVAGERRLRASKMAGLRSIPALVREMSDQESLAIALIENLQREDLNAIEEALGYKQLMEQFGLNQEELAKSMGKSRSALANSMRLLNLAKPVQTDIQQGLITAGHGRAIMAVGDEQAAAQLHERIVADGLSVRQAEALATYWKDHGLFPDFEPASGTGTTEKRSSGKRSAKDSRLLEIEQRLRKALGRKVVLKGDDGRGKLSLPFSSWDDLEELLARIGAN
ncbi:MAG: ParB/RepB/Spo0J family partition protein [Desulfovibrionaceae bacterium]